MRESAGDHEPHMGPACVLEGCREGRGNRSCSLQDSGQPEAVLEEDRG